jgi:hypothetical protein
MVVPRPGSFFFFFFFFFGFNVLGSEFGWTRYRFLGVVSVEGDDSYD